LRLRTGLEKLRGQAVEWRRALHRIPECAFEETETSRYLLEQLKKMKPDRIELMARTGIKAVFNGKRAARTVAVRADMDALPVQEETDAPYRSEKPGAMHACGHDGHMAMALAAAQVVSQSRNKMGCNAVFLFQPAEETIGGARPMVEEGALEAPHVDEIYALHLWPELPKGILGLAKGALMSAMDGVNIEITGRSAHGAKPQQGSDALVAAAHFVTAAQSIVARGIDPLEPAVLTIGKIKGGGARNVICGKVLMEGTVRSLDSAVSERVNKRIGEMLDGLTRMFGVEGKIVRTTSFPPVVNPGPLYDKVCNLLDESEYRVVAPVMVSEDFSCFQQEVPGFYALLGAGAEGYGRPLHSSRFDFDEGVLLAGVEYYLRVLELA
jgi:amidohydrolase